MNAEPRTGNRNRNPEPHQNTEPQNPEPQNPEPSNTEPRNIDPLDSAATVCPRCGESNDLAKVKGCIKCLKCNFKFDCNGW
jgi:ribosomal protein S27AE